MKISHISTVLLVCCLLGLASSSQNLYATTKSQPSNPDQVLVREPGKKYMQYLVENGDTTYIDHIVASRVFPRMPKTKSKEQKQYYRLVYNFNKTYPYALVAKCIIAEADSVIEAQNLKGFKRDSYIQKKQNELFKAFEKPMRNMTVSQGALLMKLIDRETGICSYNIIRNYKNKAAAGFWQGIAKMFGSDMKKNYEPYGADRSTEELIRYWNSGCFDEYYYSIFWEYPKKVKIPRKYLKDS